MKTPQKGIFSWDACLNERFVPDYAILEELVNSIRRNFGYTISLVSGSYDMLHIGHCRYLRETKIRADLCIVGLDSDAKIQKRKGPHRPIVPQDERLEMLVHTRYVDILTLKEPTDEKWKLIRVVRPDVLVISERMEYGEGEQEELKSLCGEVVLLESQATTSSSAKIRKLQIEVLQPALLEMKRAIGTIEESMK